MKTEEEMNRERSGCFVNSCDLSASVFLVLGAAVLQIPSPARPATTDGDGMDHYT